jgi:predicted O-methyltransferase YrrM
VPATWKGVVLREPTTLLAGAAGRDEIAQNRMVLAAARRLYGRDVGSRQFAEALAELDGPTLTPPAADLRAGISHRVTLGRWLYAAVRVARPNVIVETGVASGTSSWLILNALARNETGSLYSIDLPNRDPTRPYNVGEEGETGRVVPAELRGRWKLTLADSKIALQELLAELGGADVFFHDSDHSYGAMTREFETVLPWLRPGGLIVSDDVQKNRAFTEVTRRHGLRSFVFRKGGTARKPAG